MKVVCFANNAVGLEAVRHLRDVNAKIVALVLHDPERQKLGNEIVETAGVPDQNVICASRLNQAVTIDQIKSLSPDCGVSAFFGQIIRKPIIDLFPRGIVNLHTSLLPLNRGSWPNVWSIIDQTDAGVTMHLVDEGVDTGPVLAQEKVVICPTDNGCTLNQRLEESLIKLFKSNWKKFAAGQLRPQPQDDTKATTHRVRDSAEFDRIDLDTNYRASDLINIIRARTFPPHRGAYFEIDGQKYFLELKIEKDER
jgi:methionyl-tRNA formyltransferase